MRTMRAIGRENSGRRKDAGAATVEFAIVSILLFSLLLGILEIGRVLFMWNSAAEATRRGARVAVVCDVGAPGVIAEMRRILPALDGGNIVIAYRPAGCDSSNCEAVEVSVTGVTVTPFIPIASMTLPIPPFATTLPRESMDSSHNRYGNGNICG